MCEVMILLMKSGFMDWECIGNKVTNEIEGVV